MTVPASRKPAGRPRIRIGHVVILAAVLAFLAYKLHDFTEPFAYGHARWSDAYLYWFGMMHCDLGYAATGFLNTEGITGSGELIHYRSIGPLEGIVHSLFLCLTDGALWAVRVLPLLASLALLALLTGIQRRFRDGGNPAVLAVLLLASPFLLKYGTSDAGFWALPLTLGTAGWYLYLRFLAQGRQALLNLSILCFTLGVFANWQAGFMGLPVFLHIALSPLPWRRKLGTLALFAGGIALATAIVLLHQGLVTGDYLYPFRRVLERSEGVDPTGGSIGWGELLMLQLRRFADYFGPVAALLAGYWFIDSAIRRTLFRDGNGWTLSFLATGLFYGFLFRNAAYIHDFLIAGFLPGFMLAAAGGADLFYRHLGKFHPRAWKGGAGAAALGLLLTAHVAIGVRSAAMFETSEARDLTRGEASVALYLARHLGEQQILAADWSSGYHRTMGSDGRVYANLRPHLAYLTRRPVRFVDTPAALGALLEEAGAAGKEVVLVQLQKGAASEVLPVPGAWIAGSHRFDQGRILTLRRGPDTPRPLTGARPASPPHLPE